MSSTMAYGRSKGLDNGGARRAGRSSVVPLHAVSPIADELANLRAINAQLWSLPCWIQGSEQRLSASIGQSMCPHDGRTAEELLKGADLAMYRLKARLARPMLSLGSMPHHRPLRRRNDNSQSGSGGSLAGGDL
jgi:GGDEF domain-containing protein